MFHFRSLHWRIATAYLVLIAVIMSGLTLFLTRQVRTAALESLQETLLSEARLLAHHGALRQALDTGRMPADDRAVTSLVNEWAGLLNARITIVAPDGTVLADSERDGTVMGNHGTRPEIAAALVDGHGVAMRYSDTLARSMYYVATIIPSPVPTGSPGGAPLGVLRLALPVSRVEQTVTPLRTAVLVSSLIATLLTGLLSFFTAERVARPVRRLTETVTQMSQGNWGERIHPTRQDEVGQLIRAFNRMAGKLQVQMTFLQREQERLSIVLDNMQDGVLILDAEGRVQLINPAAARLLQVDAAQAHGLSCPQVVRDHRIVALWRRSQQSATAEGAMLELGRNIVNIVSTPFWDGLQRGFSVTFQDLTQLRRLETVRRDFVSNISHELRTPLASLRALVETLRDGALDDPPAATHFLDRIEVEVDALAQMVQELLELSRIESGRVPLQRKPTPVGDILLRPVERLQPQAERAGVELVVDLQEGLPWVNADAERMHQVVTNLIHNAIKFTPPGGAITVRARRQDGPEAGQVLFSVEDTGVGIPAADLPRIFERFYKVDRARSAGGTGLGLAIAKHMLHAHEGTIWAESSEGQGSTFFFSLPVSNPSLPHH